MRYLWLFSLAAVLTTVFSGNSALAQTIGGQNPSGPPVSPYLNLMRLGATPGINYYDLVRPQLQIQSAISNLQQNQASLIQGLAMGGNGADTLVTTGHAATFGNYSHYFPGQASSGGINAVGGLAGQRNLQNQRQLYSPVRSLGGMNTGTGFGGISNTGMSPGVIRGTTPR